MFVIKETTGAVFYQEVIFLSFTNFVSYFYLKESYVDKTKTYNSSLF